MESGRLAPGPRRRRQPRHRSSRPVPGMRTPHRGTRRRPSRHDRGGRPVCGDGRPAPRRPRGPGPRPAPDADNHAGSNGLPRHGPASAIGGPGPRADRGAGSGRAGAFGRGPARGRVRPVRGRRSGSSWAPVSRGFGWFWCCGCRGGWRWFGWFCRCRSGWRCFGWFGCCRERSQHWPGEQWHCRREPRFRGRNGGLRWDCGRRGRSCCGHRGDIRLCWSRRQARSCWGRRRFRLARPGKLRSGRCCRVRRNPIQCRGIEHRRSRHNTFRCRRIERSRSRYRSIHREGRPRRRCGAANSSRCR